MPPNAHKKHILFICKGNIFRSMTAEYALRRELGKDSSLHVSSAGTADFPYTVVPVVREYLLSYGLDVSGHVRRTLTRTILDEADMPIAMDPLPQQEVQHAFGLKPHLFLSLCYPEAASHCLPDIEEAVPEYLKDASAKNSHIRMTIDKIIAAVPVLARKLTLTKATQILEKDE